MQGDVILSGEASLSASRDYTNGLPNVKTRIFLSFPDFHGYGFAKVSLDPFQKNNNETGP
jgi:hypothetical protein